VIAPERAQDRGTRYPLLEPVGDSFAVRSQP
jgi:hypothetical protein